MPSITFCIDYVNDNPAKVRKAGIPRILAIRLLFGYTQCMEKETCMPRERRVQLRPRLLAAAELVGQAGTVADIGCDHGRLSIALLQSGAVQRAIAADVSATSLEKARVLRDYVNVTAQMETREGSGLSVLSEGEADVLAICGMGGKLIAEILSVHPPLMGAACAVLQPMRGIEQLRWYLFHNGYCVEAERIARDNGRLYQVFRVRAGQEETRCGGWPENCFLLGRKAINQPLFKELVKEMLQQRAQRLAGAIGSKGEAHLRKQMEDLLRILALCQ